MRLFNQDMSVEVRLLFFAKAREIAGKSKANIKLQSPIVSVDLFQEIVDRYSLHDIKNTLVLAWNQEFCDWSETLFLQEGDEIAVIPPLSGG